MGLLALGGELTWPHPLYSGDIPCPLTKLDFKLILENDYKTQDNIAKIFFVSRNHRVASLLKLIHLQMTIGLGKDSFF
jgi:hypothetical protein